MRQVQSGETGRHRAGTSVHRKSTPCFQSAAELWRYRELLAFLTWRNVAIRYKQTFVGIAWAVLQPLVMTGVFSLFFGHFLRVPSGDVPYPLFAYAALLPWQLFTKSLYESANSLVSDHRMVTRVYFPRILLPVSGILSAMVDFFISLCVLGLLMALYGVAPSAKMVWLPVITLMMFVTMAGAGLWLSAVNVEYRDVLYLLPFATQVLLFLTPVAYPGSIVPQEWRFLYGLNPLTGVIETFRWALFGTDIEPLTAIAIPCVSAVALFAAGIARFYRREPDFADILGTGGI